jgi:hypothetical protein
MTSDLANYENVFEGMTPWSGRVPEGFEVNSLGQLFDISLHVDPPGGGAFPEPEPERQVDTRLLGIEDGEYFFEVADIVQTVRSARGHYTLIELGGGWAPRCVDAHRALDALNPLPRKFVSVEPEPLLHMNARQNFRNNGLDPDDHWLLNSSVSANGRPGLIFTGKGRVTSSRIYGTRGDAVAEMIVSGNATETALRNLCAQMRVGIALSHDEDQSMDIVGVSSLALRDLLAPLDIVDLMDVDVQGEEIDIFAPAMDIIAKKVRRLHIGTHLMQGDTISRHRMVRQEFVEAGFDILADFEPASTHQTALGAFETPSDGILSVHNPGLY